MTGQQLRSIAGTAIVAILVASSASAQNGTSSVVFDVRAYGAKGDGVALDSPAINEAIDKASAAGGGTVWLPAGTYRSVSIHLKSNTAIHLDAGAVLVAADRSADAKYDVAEPSPSTRFQDFGHSHFHNSLLWGEHLENVSIEGPGQIVGKGLVNDFTKQMDDGNKTIALRDCRHVTIEDVTIRHGGWFGILATGVDHLKIRGLLIDTNRDGMDIDCCRDVHVSECSVNSPGDDGICLKSSYALNEARACENVTITNCHVSGFKEGTLWDGTMLREGRPTGRIKFGTESNGGFRNIAISNCTFDYCGGFALESVDGALLEDVTISNITMRDIVNSPFFLRLGRRMRGPAGTPVGKLRRVSISNVRVVGAREASTIAGIPGHSIEDVSFSHIRIQSKGGAKAEQALLVPKEDERGYPEPGALGPMPANCFFVRHAKNVEFDDIRSDMDKTDGRPPFVLDDVTGADFFKVKAARLDGLPFVRATNIRDLIIRASDGVRDLEAKSLDKGQYP